MVAVTLLSLVSLSDTVLPDLQFRYLDKIAHFTFYFGAVIFLCLARNENARKKFKLNQSITIGIIFAVLYGILMEVLQEVFTTYRDGNIYDVLTNILGAFTGAIVVHQLFHKSKIVSWKTEEK